MPKTCVRACKQIRNGSPVPHCLYSHTGFGLVQGNAFTGRLDALKLWFLSSATEFAALWPNTWTLKKCTLDTARQNSGSLIPHSELAYTHARRKMAFYLRLRGRKLVMPSRARQVQAPLTAVALSGVWAGKAVNEKLANESWQYRPLLHPRRGIWYFMDFVIEP